MSTSDASLSSRTTTRPWRVAPTLPVAVAVAVAYVVVFIGLSSTSGIAYADWFANGENAFRTAVLPLLGGSAVLVLFLVWARWDFVFRDPARLPMNGALWATVVAFLVSIVVHLAVADYGAVDTSLLLAILTAGVLVGFAEETLFRGILLRALRTDRRPESRVMLITSLAFGFFHLTNLLNGSPAAAVLVQCLQASVLGAGLYAFRRVRGLLAMGMVAHGLWDIGAFLPPPDGGLALVGTGTLMLALVSAFVAAIVVLRRDRAITVTPAGVEPR
jgi:membrane protease YdiL (CAAX protease family)